MKVYDRIQKCEKDLTTAELIDLMANGNRQVDLVFAENKSDEDGYMTWNAGSSVDKYTYLSPAFTAPEETEE